MFRTRRQELIWLVLIAGCIVLFVAHRERAQQGPAVAAYDTNGLDALVRRTMTVPVRARDGDIVTGSIKRSDRPAARKNRYYVPLGSYDSIDEATRRYLKLARHEPALEEGRKLRIETVSLGSDRFHRVRMGDFASIRQAEAACARAGVATGQCPVVAAR